MRYKLSEMIVLMLNRVSIERLLCISENDKIYFDDIPVDYMKDLMLTYNKSISDTEINLQITEIQYQMENDSKVNLSRRRGINVFDVLYYYIPEILTVYENNCVAKYTRLLEWNKLMIGIGEDLPITTYMAKSDLKEGRERHNFSWSPVIGHNNVQLNRILQKGMADNHFHLRGSAPYASIAWINLMNNPGRAEFIVEFEKIESNYRDKEKKSEAKISRQPLRNLVLEAALIRLYLCSKLADFSITVSPYYISIQEAKEEIGEVALTTLLMDEVTQIKYIPIKKIKSNVSEKRYNELIERECQKTVELLLSDCLKMENSLYAIQSEIDSLKFFTNIADYMQMYFKEKSFETEKEYQILTGERWFLYTMLKCVYAADERFDRKEYNWFYTYLRIQNELRNELVQTNDLVGFENFQIYQRRKDSFTHLNDWEKSEGALARLAVRDVLNNPAVKHLEVRISPTMCADDNAYYIREYDKAITGPVTEEEKFVEAVQYYFYRILNDDAKLVMQKKADLLQRYHYVFHFTKTADSIEERFHMLQCRHYSYRKKIIEQAEEIIRFREKYPSEAKRLVGIDASSQEIGCRPEVFGRVFRTLKNHTVPLSYIEENYELPQLKITFHVGEDYLDIVDGLRAIDEAIHFLNMDCGDRLGHAMALGIDVESWYRFKGNKITLPIQDYLDNIVWLHQKLIKYNIKDMSSLKGWLENKYSQYFAKIYQPYIHEIQHIDEKNNSKQYQGNFELYTYYLAWLLRGDEPSLYKYGDYIKEERYLDKWKQYSINKIQIKKGDIRETKEITLLYYMYHYNENVRKKGWTVETFEIPDSYIKGVKAVQKAMQEEIVKRGISIETNPSSNLRISTIDSYAKHPIKEFYNRGLTYNEQELMDCPQINVSINTDDKGVFATRLENEYALLACSMEQEKLENGKPKYRKEFIYDWLDNIREMGLRQIFLGDKNRIW